LTIADAAEKMRSGEKVGQGYAEEVKRADTTDMENMFFHYVSVLRACFTGGLLD
jgi:hypothetical protein